MPARAKPRAASQQNTGYNCRMKSAAYFLNKHFVEPSKKIQNIRCVRAIVANFPKSLTDDIKFFYIKDGVLFFVVTSSVCRQELTYKKDLFMSLLRMYRKSDPERFNLELRDIKIKLSYKDLSQKPPAKPEIPYAERARGDFKNIVKDKKLHKIFEEIKALIKYARS